MTADKLLALGVLFYFTAFGSLCSEVQRVTVAWNSVLCNRKCAQLIGKEFRKLDQLEEIRINPSAGIAELKWKPESPFSYHPVKTAMQMVGAGVNDIRVRVRGKVRAQGEDVALYSTGDNTRFLLVSPIMPDPNRQVVLPNPALREVDPRLRDTILRDAELGKTMVIEGPLYQPAQSPPLMIVVERIQVEKKEAEQPARR